MKAKDYLANLNHVFSDECILKDIPSGKFKDSLKEFLKYIKDNNVNPADVLLSPEDHIKMMSNDDTVMTCFHSITEKDYDKYIGLFHITHNTELIKQQAIMEIAEQFKEYSYPIAVARLQTYLWVSYFDFMFYVREKLGIEDSPVEKTEYIFWINTFMKMSMEVSHFFCKLIAGLDAEDLEELKQIYTLFLDKLDESEPTTIH